MKRRQYVVVRPNRPPGSPVSRLLSLASVASVPPGSLDPPGLLAWKRGEIAAYFQLVYYIKYWTWREGRAQGQMMGGRKEEKKKRDSRASIDGHPSGLYVHSSSIHPLSAFFSDMENRRLQNVTVTHPPCEQKKMELQHGRLVLERQRSRDNIWLHSVAFYGLQKSKAARDMLSTSGQLIVRPAAAVVSWLLPQFIDTTLHFLATQCASDKKKRQAALDMTDEFRTTSPSTSNSLLNLCRTPARLSLLCWFVPIESRRARIWQLALLVRRGNQHKVKSTKAAMLRQTSGGMRKWHLGPIGPDQSNM